MDLETDRAREAVLILFICAFIVIVLAFRYCERSTQIRQTDGDKKMQQVQEQKTQTNIMDIGVTVQVGMQRERIR